jgi:Domain of unknown function (DUF4111)/Nucleotidyltransferase domain
VPSLPEPLDRILPALIDDMRASLGPDLVGAYLYGSAVSGGFDPAISDLDVVVVTERSSDEIEFEVFDGVVRRLAAREPDWAERLDITFVGRQTLATFRSGGPLVEISHEEPLHRIPNADDWIETWFLAREADTPLIGPSAKDVIPPIDFDEFIRGVALDVDRLVERARTDPLDRAVAYRLLTLSRALTSLETGRICSKDEAAAWVANRFPETAPALEAAREVRQTHGTRSFTEEERTAVRSLMLFVADEIRRTGPPELPSWRRPDSGGSSAPRYASIQPVDPSAGADPSVDRTGRRELWTCPRCGHRFVSPNLWHSCSHHAVDEHFVRAEPQVRAAFDRLVELYERCGPIVGIAQKTRIGFMVRARFGGCQVKRDRIATNVPLPRRVEHPCWKRVEQLGRWYLHYYDIREPAISMTPSCRR